MSLSQKNTRSKSFNPLDVGVNNDYKFDAIRHSSYSNVYILKLRDDSLDYSKYRHSELQYLKLYTRKLDLNGAIKTLTFGSKNGEYTHSKMKFDKQLGNVLFGKDSRTKREVRCTLIGPVDEEGICTPVMVKLWISPRTDNNNGRFFLDSTYKVV